MHCILDYGLILTNMTLIVQQFSWRVKQLLAFITLISASILFATMWTFPENKSISQEQIAMFAIALTHLLFFDSLCILNIQEYLLGNFCVPFCAGSAEVVKSNIKPFIDFSMYLKIVITNLFWSFLLLHCLYFGCSTILICSAYVENV